MSVPSEIDGVPMTPGELAVWAAAFVGKGISFAMTPDEANEYDSREQDSTQHSAYLRAVTDAVSRASNVVRWIREVP